MEMEIQHKQQRTAVQWCKIEFKILNMLNAWKSYSGASKEHAYYTVTDIIQYLDENHIDYDKMFNEYHYEIKYFIVLRNGREQNICHMCVNHQNPEHIMGKYYYSSAGAEMSLSIFLSMMIIAQNYCSKCKTNLITIKHKLYDL